MSKMRVKCQICHNSGISFMDAMAYSSGGKMSCRVCGKRPGLTLVSSFFYKIIEGVIILFAIFYSFYLNIALPMFLLIPLILSVRVFVLPRFAIQKEKNKMKQRGQTSLKDK